MTPRLFRLLIPLLAVALALTPLPAQPTAPKKYALLIGINKYNHADMNKPKALEYAERDIAAAKALFEGAGYEVKVILGEEATLAVLRTAIKTLANKGSSDGVVVVGLSGHGVQPDGEPEAYYCPFDTRMRVAMRDGKPVVRNGKPVIEPDPETMLPLTEVLTALKLSPAGSRLMLADCCRNDKSTGRSGGAGTGLKVGDLPDNTAVLLACSRGQEAYEDQAWGDGHGAFFYHAMEGMRGKAADDRGRVTGARLAEYLEDVVPADVARVKKQGAEQKPFWLVSGRVDLQLQKIGPKAGEERDFEIAKGVKMRFCWVPSGKATLGSPTTEKDRSEVEKEHEFTTRGFWLGKYEVMQGEWTSVMGSNPSAFASTGTDADYRDRVKGLDTSRFPVERVSWNDCQAFLKKVNEGPGRARGRFVLPHEDEWEYACRGGKGNGQAFYWGNVLNGREANCNGEYPYGGAAKGPNLKRPEVVGSYAKDYPHPWGLCDMAGNVWEWCDNKYSQSNDSRVLRGGSWYSYSGYCRASYRNGSTPVNAFGSVGFRVCLPLD